MKHCQKVSYILPKFLIYSWAYEYKCVDHFIYIRGPTHLYSVTIPTHWEIGKLLHEGEGIKKGHLKGYFETASFGGINQMKLMLYLKA